MKPYETTQIIERVRYSTGTATLLAGDDWWDGHNHERRGTNRFLYRTPRGRYFFAELSQWQGAFNGLVPCTESEAIEFFESVPAGCQRVDYEKAFPGVKVEEG